MIDNIELAHDGEELKFANFQFGVGFPAIWGSCGSDGQGGEQPEDAGTLYVTIAYPEDEIYEQGLTFKVTLQAIVKDMFDGMDSNGWIEADSVEDAKRVIRRLRDAADYLDDRIEKAVPLI